MHVETAVDQERNGPEGAGRNSCRLPPGPRTRPGAPSTPQQASDRLAEALAATLCRYTLDAEAGPPVADPGRESTGPARSLEIRAGKQTVVFPVLPGKRNWSYFSKGTQPGELGARLGRLSFPDGAFIDDSAPVSVLAARIVETFDRKGADMD